MRRRAAVLAGLLALACSGGGRDDNDDDPTEPTDPRPGRVRGITVTPATLALAVGERGELAAAVDADDGVSTRHTWSASDPAAVTVTAAGQVTAVRAAEAVEVCATATADRSKRACAAVTVTAPAAPPAPVAAVEVAPATLTLAPGATQALTATARDAAGAVIAGRPVAWSTSAPAVATVGADGTVTGVAAGAATVTATVDGRAGSAAVTVGGTAAPACAAVGALAPGQTVTGTLSAADCRLDDGSHAQKWTLTLAAAAAVELEMTSTAVDAYLAVTDAAGRVVAADDDGAGGRNARVTAALEAGAYVVYANTFGPGEFGAYQLAARAGGAADACVTARPLAVPQAVTGTLGPASCRLRDGSFADRYRFTVAARATVQLDMTSTAVDPFLSVLDAAGALVESDDDGGEGANARAVVTVEPGTYTVVANSYGPGEAGAYRLEARAWNDPCAASRPIALGATVREELAAGDCRLGNGANVRRWLLTLAAPTSVRVALSSTAFDAYLVVQNAATGQTVAEDDDGGDAGGDARLQANLPAGQFVINVTSSAAGSTGAFELAVAQLAAPGGVRVAVTPDAGALAPGQTLQLQAAVTGAANTAVTWQSTAPAVATVSAAGLVRAIGAGRADIVATAAADPSQSARAVVTVSASAATVNLDVAAAYAVQAVQSSDGRVPLVADRDAVVRVFVRGSRAGLAPVRVRVRLYNGTAVAGTYTGTATPAAALDEGCCAADVPVPGAQLQPGRALLVDVDPDGAVAEANEGDNAFPVSGTPQPLRVLRVPDFNIRLVPVNQAKAGRTGAVTDALLAHTRALWPLARVNVQVRATHTTNLPPLEADDRNGSWGALLREIDQLRRLENGTGHYYGVVKVAYASGTAGLGYLGGRSAIGVDAAGRVGSETLAHELGHNFNRQHAPCGDTYQPANVDPNYPNRDGRTGAYGMDLANGNRVVPADATDLMTYCGNKWISPYNYVAVADYRAGAAAAQTAAGPVLVLSGTGGPDGVRLEPAFHVVARADASDPAGRYEAEGRAADGRVLFRHRFNALRAPDGDARFEALAASVPVAPEVAAQLAEVRVRDRVRAVTGALRAHAAADAGARPGTAPARARLADLRAVLAGRRGSLRWDAQAFPGVVVRSRRSGQVLAIGRAGSVELDVADEGPLVEVLLSNGATSVARTLDLRTGAVAP